MAPIKGIKVKIGGEIKFLMIDSGATASLIKLDKIPKICNWNKNAKFNINGIGGKVNVEGKIFTNIQIENRQVDYEFIVIKNFVSNFDGILGMDFIEKFKAIYDNDNNNIIIKYNGKNYANKLIKENFNSFVVTKRSEIIQYVSIL